MRTARAKDYWRRTIKRQYTNYIKDIDLNNYNGIQNIEFAQGIYAICGLNGAGKSTIISAIKDILGMNKSRNDRLKLEDAKITGHVVINGEEKECTNLDKQAFSVGLDEENILFIDYESSQAVMTFFSNEDNLKELLEQNEEIEIQKEDLEEMSYLVGKSYSASKIIEVEDLADGKPMPYFEVESYGTKYDSRKMGLGEHFLIYMFWRMYNIKRDSIMILEEPETFIGIESQRHLMDYIAKIVSEKGVTVIITTHSPFILENITAEKISILGRINNTVSIAKPSLELSVNDILGGRDRVKGTFWVEDIAAEMFLAILLEQYAPCLLRKYTIIPAGSESDISKCLKFFNNSKIKYEFIGIYDGDMKGKVQDKEFNWKYTFLPMDDNVETTLKRTLLEDAKNINVFCDAIKKKPEELNVILSRIDGQNHHDWFLDLCRYISGDKLLVLRELSKLWMLDNRQDIELFVKELMAFEDSQ